MAAICHTPLFETPDIPDRDAELMLRAKSGDRGAFDLLFKEHRAPIQRFVFRMIRDRAEAEDVTQEVFLRVYRYRQGYEVTAKFTTWLYRIAGHVTLNWIRDHSRFRQHQPLDVPRGVRPYKPFVDSAARIDDWLVFQHTVEELRSAIEELPERQRKIVFLHKFEELGCEEIAAALGCSSQAVRSVLCRAYSKLRERLAAAPEQRA